MPTPLAAADAAVFAAAAPRDALRDAPRVSRPAPAAALAAPAPAPAAEEEEEEQGEEEEEEEEAEGERDETPGARCA
jgi:hypothetical protein